VKKLLGRIKKMDFSYYNPVKIQFGQDKLNLLDTIIGDRRALLITTSVFRELGLVDNIFSITDQIVFVLDDINPNPTFKDLKSKYNIIYQNDFDVIVALGGGAVIDSAKILSVYNESKNFEFVEKLIKEEKKDPFYKRIPVIAIPTTSGTGSEVTPWATVWDMENKKKYSFQLKDLWCEAALFDPIITFSMPKALTIQTALDALSHSLESIWNKNANFLSIKHAVGAAKIILEYLPLAVDDLFNIEYREKLMLASLLAAFAFSNTKTAIAHAISYYITIQKGVPHGIACSFTLPDIVDAVISQDKRVDDALKEIFGELSSRKLRNFLNKLEVSTRLDSYGIKKENFIDLQNFLICNQRAKNSIVDNSKLFKMFEKQLG